MGNVSAVKTYEWQDGRRVEIGAKNSPPRIPSQKKRLESCLRERQRVDYEKGK